MAVRTVGDPGDGNAAGVANGRVEVYTVPGLGQIFALHDQGCEVVPQRGGEHRGAMRRTPGVQLRLGDGQAGASVLDHTALDPGQAGGGGGLARGMVCYEVVVVNVGHGAPAIGVEAIGEVTGDVGLEMEHREPAE
jgi:hypothetical protein